MSKKMKLSLEKLKVQSFVTSEEKEKAKGGFTGNCGSFIYVTCPDPNCDFQSIPVDECLYTLTNCNTCHPYCTVGCGGGGTGGAKDPYVD